MSWQNELTVIVRVLINDLKDPYDFNDERIEQAISVAAKYVQLDVNLDRIYEVDVVNSNILPDPVEENDQIFTSLLCLKAACIIDQGTYRTKAAMEGVRAALGPASLSVAGNSAAWKNILDNGACGMYEELTSHWDIKNATAIAAILGPFAGNKFDPELQNVRSTYGHRNSFFNP
jgi:hypothetical protein